MKSVAGPNLLHHLACFMIVLPCLLSTIKEAATRCDWLKTYLIIRIFTDQCSRSQPIRTIFVLIDLKGGVDDIGAHLDQAICSSRPDIPCHKGTGDRWSVVGVVIHTKVFHAAFGR